MDNPFFIERPKHIAIIMDGNGRWAEKRMMDRLKGHEIGVRTAKEIIVCSSELGINELTLYVFSTENWNRSRCEVNGLMKIFNFFLESEKNFFIRNNILFNVIGQIYRLPFFLKKRIDYIMKKTRKNGGIRLNLAISYGGRYEITNAIFKIASKIKKCILEPEEITSSLISENLYGCNSSDPDLLIRTGGENRISNFLLWQIAYTEFFFTNTLWPNFSSAEFIKIVKEFSRRNRRFGYNV